MVSGSLPGRGYLIFFLTSCTRPILRPCDLAVYKTDTSVPQNRPNSLAAFFKAPAGTGLSNGSVSKVAPPLPEIRFHNPVTCPFTTVTGRKMPFVETARP